MNFQYNKISKLKYEGKNQAYLLKAKEENKFISNEWLTFLQARELGLKIKKGSKGVAIFRGFVDILVDKNGKKTSESKPLKFAYVFNLDQTEKLNKKSVV